MTSLDRRSALAAFAAVLSVPASGIAQAAESDNAETVVRYVAAWNAHDAAAAAALLADDAVYFAAATGKPIEGREAIATYIAAFTGAVPDLHWEMLGNPVSQGEIVAFQWRMSGTNSGAWPDGTAASGAGIFLLGASFLAIRGGRVVSHSDYYDAAGLHGHSGAQPIPTK